MSSLYKRQLSNNDTMEIIKWVLIFLLSAVLLKNLMDINNITNYSPGHTMVLKNEGNVDFCDDKTLSSLLEKIPQKNPNYKRPDGMGSKYDIHNLSYVNNFVIDNLNKATGGCFKNIGFHDIHFNNGTYDMVMSLWEQKKYFNVMIHAVVVVDQSNKMSLDLIRMTTPVPVDDKFSLNGRTSFEKLEIGDHNYHGTHSVKGLVRNEDYKHADIEPTKPYNDFELKEEAPANV